MKLGIMVIATDPKSEEATVERFWMPFPSMENLKGAIYRAKNLEDQYNIHFRMLVDSDNNPVVRDLDDNWEIVIP